MVPNGWERKPLEKVAEIKTGVAKGKKGLKDPIEVPYLRVANVQDGHIDLSEVKTIQIERHQLERYSLQVGDVLMTEGGDFDKLGRGDVWQGQIAPCLNQNHVFAVRPNKQVLLPYFLAALSGSSYGKTYFLSCAKRSTNLASINSTQLKEFPVLLPPLPEQRKIAKILSTWDKAINTTEKLIESSKQQKKALMQQLLTGKKRLVNPETGKVFEGEWEEVHIGDICSVKGGKRLPKGESLQNVPNNHPYIRVADMFMGGVDCSNILYVPEHIAPSISRYTIKSEDLFITVAGTLGLVGKVPPKLDGANLTENADKLTDIKCNQTFLMYVLMSPVIQKHIEAESTQNAQPKLALSRIRGFKLLVPEKSEQQKIASVLTAADKETKVLEAKLAHFKQEKKALMQQLLTGKRRVSLSS